MPNKVAQNLMSIVDRLARKYARWSGEVDDLRSVGQDALFEAWNRHHAAEAPLAPSVAHRRPIRTVVHAEVRFRVMA